MRKDQQNKDDRGLFYPVILMRQVSLMLGKLGLFLVVFMALYAELDEIGQHFFGENGKYVTLAFVCLLVLGGWAAFFYCDDMVEEIKAGKRLRNTYTLIKSVALLLVTYGLLKYQYQNMHGEASHSFIRAMLKIIF